jgi:nucleoside-diphosphate-sugar epimerase
MIETYLVTGGAGFIGSHIVKRLLREGKRVRSVDNFSTGQRERLQGVIGDMEFIEGDLADPAIGERVVEDIDYVIHQAAIPSVQRSIRDPIGTNRANVVATLNLLESSRKAAVKRFVYAASSSAYGDTEVLPKKEEMAANPLSPYALQKFVGERYCKLYYELYKLETVALRYFNVFGPGQDPHSEYSAVIPKFATSLTAGKPLTIFGDGEQSRDFTYVENVVDANLAALLSPEAPGHVINIGCGHRTTLNDIIHKLEKIIGVKASVQFHPRRPGDVRHSLAELSLARRILGYEAKVDVDTGLAITVKSFGAA